MLGGIHCGSTRMVTSNKAPKTAKTVFELNKAHNPSSLKKGADGCRLNAVGLLRVLSMRPISFSAAEEPSDYTDENFRRDASTSDACITICRTVH